MAGLAFRLGGYFRQFKKYVSKDGLILSVSTFKSKVSKNGLKKFIGVGTAVVSTITAYKIFFQDMSKGYEWYTELITERQEEEARRNMIGNDVAHGLAWSYYSGYLLNVLPDIEKKIEESEWFKGRQFSKNEIIQKKLYVLIPRKCYVELRGTDDNLNFEKNITIEVENSGNKREINVPVYSIMDGNMKYYCLCDCPLALKTINTMNDIQLAGISRSKVPSFTIDTKLIQLMRFYYAMSSFLCLKKDTDLTKKTRLLLFNDSDKKPSDVLLNAIKEDLPNSSSKQNFRFLNFLRWGHSCRSDTSSSQKTRGSLMENKLLSAEETKDVFYDFDVFITHSEKVNNKEELEKINKELKDREINVLAEKDCLGKDWLEKLKFAATKCRWIVFLDKKGSKSKTFMSSKVVDSLKNILETRRVQSVAIVNRRDELFIHDDLRWVTCIPYHDNEKHLIDTLCNVMSGSEVQLKNSEDLYPKPGEAAVGLAWGYAVNYLNKVLPEMKEKVAKEKNTFNAGIVFPEKLFIVVPESCQTASLLKDVEFLKHTESSPSSARSYQFNVYMLDKSTYFVGQYAETVATIRKMHEAGLLDEKQMKMELKTYFTTVQNIMKIFFPEKRNDYEFVYLSDTENTDKKKKKTLFEVLADKVRQ